jgi:hypothetical protein
LFSFDTRFLSKWVLTVDGERLSALSTDDLSYFETRYFLVAGSGTVYVDAKLSVIRRRAVSEGFRETLEVLNHDDQPVDLTLRIEADADFADLFEVKDALKKKGAYTREAAPGRLRLGYVRDTYRRSTAISSLPKAKADEAGLTFRIHLRPHESWKAELEVVTEFAGLERLARSSGRERGRANMESELARWLDGAPKLYCDWEPLLTAYRRSLVDLAALRFSPLTAGRRSLPGGRPPVVHDDVRPRQHHHEPAGAALHHRARRYDAAGARHQAGHANGRFPRRRPGPNPPRDEVWGDDGFRGAAALAVLRKCGRDASVRRPA